MKEITIYQCTDGIRFDKKDEALHYDELYRKVESIMSRLNPRIGDMSHMYVQQDVNMINSVKRDFLILCSEEMPYYRKLFLECAEGIRHISHAQYIVESSQYCDTCLHKAFFRFNCMSESGKEYQQPYFSVHEEEFRKEVNDYIQNKKRDHEKKSKNNYSSK
jgi:hypothetical protein